MKKERIRLIVVAGFVALLTLPVKAGVQSSAPKPEDDTFDLRTDSAASSETVRQRYRSAQLTTARAGSVTAAMGAMTSARADLVKELPLSYATTNQAGSLVEVVGVHEGAPTLVLASTGLPPKTITIPNPAGGTRTVPDLTGKKPQDLKLVSSDDFLTKPNLVELPASVVASFLNGHAGLYGLSPVAVGALKKTADYANQESNTYWVEYQQEANGIPVFQGYLRAALTAKHALVRTTSRLAPGLDASLLTAATPGSPLDAVVAGAKSLGVAASAGDFRLLSKAPAAGQPKGLVSAGPFNDDIHVELTYFPLEPGVLTLAYSMQLTLPGESYYLVVDAQDGTLLFRKNCISHQSQAASYTIFNGDSPGPLSPTYATPGSGVQGPYMGQSTVTLVGNEYPNTFNNNGWIPDGSNSLSGNNGYVTIGDYDTQYGSYHPAPITVNNRTFGFGITPPPGGSDATNDSLYHQSAVATNAFYWMNWYHDSLYRLGFTETDRNFQSDNFGRGGSGNDPIHVFVQSQYGPNNAFFDSHPDGTGGGVYLTLFTSASPARDTGLDQEVVLHELTHGVSTRLHGNVTGLASGVAAGMGEGWSDFYALSLLSTSSNDSNPDGLYAYGAYVTYNFNRTYYTRTGEGELIEHDAEEGTDNYYYGIRRFPYATKFNIGSNNLPHNPLVFSDQSTSKTLSPGAANPNQAIVGGPYYAMNEAHNIGEIWCMALLEMRAHMIRRLGFDTGNDRAMRLVYNAMKNDPITPDMVTGRDSLINTAAMSSDPNDVNDVKLGFAIRGIGNVGNGSHNGAYYNSFAYGVPNTNGQCVDSFVTNVAPFFSGESAIPPGTFYYLQFPNNGTVYGFYNYDHYPNLFHADLGFQYCIPAGGGDNGAYFYDYGLQTYLYTSPTYPFPYFYDFNLGKTIYYFPDGNRPGHYTTNPRVFSDTSNGQIFTSYN